jgi:hypothetical protein
MEEAQAAMTLRAIREAAQDAGLTREQVQALGVALRRRLAEAAGENGPEVEAAEARLAELRDRIKANENRRLSNLAERRAREITKTTALFPPDELLPGHDDA